MTTGGKPQPVHVITDADLRENGGTYIVLSGPAMRITGFDDAATRGVLGGAAMPVYVVNGTPLESRGVEGSAAQPLYSVANRPVDGHYAVPVYVENYAEWDAVTPPVPPTPPRDFEQYLTSWFDFSVGGRLVDALGNRPIHKLSGPTTYDSGKIGDALSVSTASVEENPAGLSYYGPQQIVPHSGFAFGGWVYVDGFTYWGLSQYGTTSGDWIDINYNTFSMGMYSEEIEIDFPAVGATFDIAALGMTADAWHFWMIWYDADTDTLGCRIDGNETSVTRIIAPVVTGPNALLSIGFPFQVYSGTFELDSIFICESGFPSQDDRDWLYNNGDGRSSADLTITAPSEELPNVVDSLRAWYPMNDGGEFGAVYAYDVHGMLDLDSNGTLSQVAGKVGFALYLDDLSAATESTNWDFATQYNTYDGSFAVSGWAKLDDAADIACLGQGVWYEIGAAYTDYALTIQVASEADSAFLRVRDRTLAKNAVTDFGLTTGTWFFFFFAFNGSTNVLTLRINNTTFTASGSAPAAYSGFGQGQFTINSIADTAANPIQGKASYDEVALWIGYVPSSTEINTLYALGANAGYPDAVNAWRGIV